MKPSNAKGTRDYSALQVAKRYYIFDTLKSIFSKYGFCPIETPAVEKLSTLTGKYGEEGDQLLFKVLNNGDFLKSVKDEDLQNRDYKKMTHDMSSRGLRYDLTVPFARYVSQHQSEIQFPFKRYQIQPVWRGDRPQKGRYQEFYQCDVDVVGSDSLMYEAELVRILDEGFRALQIPIVIKLNNRKVLNGIAEVAGVQDQFTDMTVAIDKLDKIGQEGVEKELTKRNIAPDSITKIFELLSIKELPKLKEALGSSEVGLKGIDELETVFNYINLQPIESTVELDYTLARGLNYYTGCIFEVKAVGVEMGSISGGGRYDDLTSAFGLKNISGVGISFGADRIFDVLEELNKFPSRIEKSTKVLLIAMDDKSHLFAYKSLHYFREANISADLYPEPAKMKKQMKYANNKNIPFVIIIGESEMETGMLMLKNMETGMQVQSTLGEIIRKLS